jgi:hypothetical protein
MQGKLSAAFGVFMEVRSDSEVDGEHQRRAGSAGPTFRRI